MRAMQEDKKNRKVEVNREKLVATLKANLEHHIAEYEEAKAGYKANLLHQVDVAYAAAKESLEENYEKLKATISAMDDSKLAAASDWVTLVKEKSVQMRAPKCYAREYETAIQMAEWDVRESIELTHAEFVCFVQDEWDWQEDFREVTAFYKSFKG